MGKKQTILVVDDVKTNIDILLEILYEYDIVVALDGMSALEILENENDIDLILLDVMMPKIDGFEVCRLIKKDEKIASIPVIFITAKSDDASIEEGFRIGGVDYIQKPFRPVELLARVKTHLQLKENQKKVSQLEKFTAIAEFLENIAHQWRQPLSAISVASSGMMMQQEMGILKEDVIRSTCESITTHTQNLSATIEKMVQITNQHTPHIFFSPYNVIEENRSRIFPLSPWVEYYTDIAKEVKIKGSSDSFLVLIENLLQNSIDAIIHNNISDGMVNFSLIQRDQKIIIRFCDNGGGIQKEYIQNIFEPYFTTRHKAIGKGLGLYLVYFIIKESFGGTIEAFNEEFTYKEKRYKGATFEITLPSF